MSAALSETIPSPSRTLAQAPAVERASDHDRRISVLLRTMAPFPKSLCLRLPIHTTAQQILEGVSSQLNLDGSSSRMLRLYTRSGRSLSSSMTLSGIMAKYFSTGPSDHLDLELRLCVLGGKGGFGSMLRAQGGKMSARKGEENTDACRDLNGRRLKTVKEAQNLAAYLAAAPEREAALSKAQAEKYAKLERMLGRKPRTQGDFEEAAGRLDDAGGDLGGLQRSAGDADNDEDDNTSGSAPTNLVPVQGKEASSSGVSGGSGSKRGVQTSSADQQAPRRKEYLEDHKYLEESREAVDKAKSAVALAMAKQKQKQKQKKGKQVEPIAASTPAVDTSVATGPAPTAA